MKAVVMEKHGEVGELEIKDVAEPHPAHGEVVLKLHAAALNHLDIWTRKGGRAVIPMPHVPGTDGAGVVAAVGRTFATCARATR